MPDLKKLITLEALEAALPSWLKSLTKPSYTASDVGAIATTEKGAASGVAELDANGKVPSSQLPSYVDDVLEYSAKSSFPATGETGKIYVDTSDNKTYRWSGTTYVEISPSLALGETSSTAYYGDKGKTAYDHATDSSRLTTATASGLYKVASTAQGHIASLTPVEKADITALGIPGSDTNTHRPIRVNGTQVLGDNTTALNLKAGSNVNLSNSSGTVTIDATDTTYSNATTQVAGLMSASDKTKLNGISTGANKIGYVIKQINLSNDVIWSQSMSGMYYTSKVSIPELSRVLGVTICGFYNLKNTDVIMPRIYGDSNYNGISFFGNTDTFSSGANVDVQVFGIV